MKVKRWNKIVVILGALLFMLKAPTTLVAETEIKAETPFEIFLEKQGDYWISLPIKTPFLFNSVIVELPMPTTALEVNFNRTKPLWRLAKSTNQWRAVAVHEDGFGPSNLFFTEPANTLQFRHKINKDPKPPFDPLLEPRFEPLLDPPSGINIKVTLIAYVAEEFTQENWLAGDLVAEQPSFRIIKRSEWGADETLRYWNPELDPDSRILSGEQSSNDEKPAADPCNSILTQYKDEIGIKKTVERDAQGELYTWPLAYSKKIQKIVIHHTDSEIRDLNDNRRVDSLDMKAMMRGIYRFHTVTRGWGDIGYNYIIDPFGNIYEGRYGGEGVIGAHVLCHNNGTIGIAIIGNYEDSRPSEPAMQAVSFLVAQKAKLHGLDPIKDSTFRGKLLGNVMGHKDVRATSCPGQALYASLPEIRKKAAILLRGAEFSDEALSAATLDYNAELVSNIELLNMHPTRREKLKLIFRNTGKQTWDQNTWLHVALNNQKQMQVIPLLSDKSYVAGDLLQNQVLPGQTGTFEIELEAGHAGGFYTFELSPVINGRYKISRSSVIVPIMVDEPQLKYQVIENTLPAGVVYQGQILNASVQLKNIGNIIWRNYGDHPITLGTDGPKDRQSIFIKENASRMAYLKESEVLPNQTGTFIFNLEVPRKRQATYQEYFRPVIEGVGWLEDQKLNFKVTVKKPVHRATISKKTNITKMTPGEMREFQIEIENQGDVKWVDENVEIALNSRGIKVFKQKIDLVTPLEPHTKGIYSFWVQAPYGERPGRHQISVRATFNKLPIKGGEVSFMIGVPAARLSASMTSQSERVQLLKSGEEATLQVQFKNTGNGIWRNKGTNAVYLAPSRPAKPLDRLSKLYFEENWPSRYRATLLKESIVKPGEVGTFEFKVRAPAQGIYKEYFQLLVENVGWINGGSVRWDIRVIAKTSGSQSESPSTPQLGQPSDQSSDPQSGNQSREDRGATIRIKLSYADIRSTLLAFNEDYRVEDAAGNILFKIPEGGSADFSFDKNSVAIKHENNSKTLPIIRLIPESADGILEISSWQRRPSWNLDLNDNQFRGTLEIRVIDGQPLYLNELALEDYLKGIAEVSNSHPSEKLKTLAVLARTYAQFYLDPNQRKFPGQPYDGSDDPEIFQKYLGYGYEKRSPNFLAAVIDTKGEVVTYQGKLVKTPYFNQSDGRTRSAEEVWGWKNTPYLKSVADDFCPEKKLKGHGVGLSGCGATELAKQGKKYDEIIKYYFTDVAIEKK